MMHSADELQGADEYLPPGGTVPGDAAVGLRADSLAAGVVFLLALTVVQRMVGFVREVLFCRWLGPEQLGQWNMAWGFLLLAAPLAVFSLPGVFGRYVEHYRARGQLRVFLRRTAAFCTVTSLVAVAMMCLARPWFSAFIFGTDTDLQLVLLLAGSLLAVIAYNYLISLFTALRSMRLVSGLELVNSLAFALLAVALLWQWRCGAESVVIAYGGACLLCSLGSWPFLRLVWQGSPERAALPRPVLWAKLAPFTVSVCAINLLSNLFAYADRYMIVHFAPGSAEETLSLVGHYHSSRVLPLLLISVASMLGTMLLPHLSHDWEAGRRDRVSRRLNLFLKLLALAMTAAAVAVLLIAPLLFNVAFQGKYAGGLAVLPWTLVYSVWFGVAMVAQMYLWCAERASLVGVAVLVGLVVSVSLNPLLLPRMGLLGAVLATAAANVALLLTIFWFSRRLGWHVDRGLWTILGVPVALCLGPWVASLVLAVVAWEAIAADRLFGRQEKRQLADGLLEYWRRFRTIRGGRSLLGGQR